MYDDCTIRIRRLQNGFNVSMTDPEIVKQNAKRRDAEDGCCAVAWKDPEVSYAFTTTDEVVDFVKNNIEKALPRDEYSSTFDKMVGSKK